MDPVQSWLDAKEVRRMAESLMAPAPKVDESVADAGYSDDFEGFADTAQPDPLQQEQEVDRPRPQPHQMTHQPHAAGDMDGAQRVVVGNALADARRLAEESGMLHQEQQATEVDPPVDQTVSPIPSSHSQHVQVASSVVQGESPNPSSGPSHESPFQVSDDQQHSHHDPVARQVSPAVSDPDHLSSASSESVQGPELAGPVVASEPKGSEFPPVPPVAPSQPQAAPVFQPKSQPEIVSQSTGSTAVKGAARGPFLSRLQQFSVILRRELDAEAMFLIDHEGQVLLDEVENVKLIQVARTLANASYRASRQTAGVAGLAAVGNLHVKIGARATLEVIPVDSRYGLLILGVIFPEPLGAERVVQVAELLQKTVEPNQQD